MPYHQELILDNFTAFRAAHFKFSPGINVLVGENGTGKTHVMKLLYVIQYHLFRDNGSMNSLLLGVFQSDSNTDIVRNGGGRANIKGYFNNGHWDFDIMKIKDFHERDIHPSGGYSLLTNPKRPIFIPSIDMMGHTKRFISTYDEYQIDFDQTHRDIVALLLSPEKRSTQENQNPGLKILTNILGGEIEEESERFYLKTPQGRQAMPLVADGLRKIATLYQLIKNGWLEPGTVLFWDEPEIHLSPVLMDEVVAVLLELARSGVQIFLATHSYVILKELDLQALAADDVRYFALESTPEGTTVEMTSDYAQLHPNPIAEQFDSLYDRELTRATGRRRK